MEKITKTDKLFEKNFEFKEDLLKANDAYNEYLTAQEDIKNYERKDGIKSTTIKYYSNFIVDWMDMFNSDVNWSLERVKTEEALRLKEQITNAIEMAIMLGVRYQLMEDFSEEVAKTIAKAEEIRKSEKSVI